MMLRGCVYALQKEQVLLALVFVIRFPLPLSLSLSLLIPWVFRKLISK